jgi:hypothetical protein
MEKPWDISQLDKTSDKYQHSKKEMTSSPSNCQGQSRSSRLRNCQHPGAGQGDSDSEDAISD